jgi:hypothetical protein
MTLTILALVLGTTILGIIIHVIWWRIKRPKDDVLALAFATIAIPFGANWIMCSRINPSLWVPHTLNIECLLSIAALGIIHFFVGFYYMGCYTGAQAASPTVLILLMADNKSEGVTKEEIETKLTDDIVCGNLVEAAIHERFIIDEKNKLTVGPRGRLLLSFGRTARKLVGFPVNPAG